MAEVEVKGLTPENAVLLIAAAESKGMSRDVVKTTGRGVFLVPEEVAKEAGLVDDGSKAEDKPKRTVKRADRKESSDG